MHPLHSAIPYQPSVPAHNINANVAPYTPSLPSRYSTYNVFSNLQMSPYYQILVTFMNIYWWRVNLITSSDTDDRIRTIFTATAGSFRASIIEFYKRYLIKQRRIGAEAASRMDFTKTPKEELTRFFLFLRRFSSLRTATGTIDQLFNVMYGTDPQSANYSFEDAYIELGQSRSLTVLVQLHNSLESFKESATRNIWDNFRSQPVSGQDFLPG